MSSITILKVRDLRPQIICPLCSGYFIDATTIVECLHSFCRACIVLYLENSKCCPICDIQIHKTKPLLNIRPDKTLQDIVFKLVPGLFEDEMRRRRQFYAEHPDQEPSDVEENGKATTQHSRVYSSNDKINVAISPRQTSASTTLNGEDHPKTDGKSEHTRYYYCPAMVTVGHLKHLIKSKYSTANEDSMRVELYWKNIQLPDSYTLIDVGYTYPWDRSKPMELTYSMNDANAEASSTRFCHLAMWRLRRKKHKKRRGSAMEGDELDSEFDGAQRSKKRKRRRNHSVPREALPASSVEQMDSTSPVCDSETVPATSSDLSSEEPPSSDKTPPSPCRGASSSEDDAKENVAQEENDVDTPHPAETSDSSVPLTDAALIPLRSGNASSCDTDEKQIRPDAKAASPPPEPILNGGSEKCELVVQQTVPKSLLPPACPSPVERMTAKRVATPKPIETPPPARDLRKRNKRCLTPVVQNGLVDGEREELRSEPHIGPFSSNSPLFPWGMSPWSQYYQRHLNLAGSYGPPLLPLVPSPLSLSPSPMSPSSSFLPSSSSSSSASGLLNHSPYYFPPSSPVPPISPFASPHAPLGSPVPSSNAFPASTTSTWASSSSLSPSIPSPAMNYRQYHQHLHHHLHYPPALTSQQASLLSPRSSWDPMEYSSMFDAFSSSRAQLFDRFMKSSGLNGSALANSPGSSHHLSFSMSASTSSFSPSVPFPPFRPISTPSLFSTQSLFPSAPSCQRELPKP